MLTRDDARLLKGTLAEAIDAMTDGAEPPLPPDTDLSEILVAIESLTVQVAAIYDVLSTRTPNPLPVDIVAISAPEEVTEASPLPVKVVE